MSCIDCGAREKRGWGVVKLANGEVKRVCDKCWKRHYKPWFGHPEKIKRY